MKFINENNLLLPHHVEMIKKMKQELEEGKIIFFSSGLRSGKTAMYNSLKEYKFKNNG